MQMKVPPCKRSEVDVCTACKRKFFRKTVKKMESDEDSDASSNEECTTKVLESYVTAGGIHANSNIDHIVDGIARQTYVCLICIEKVVKTSKIWNCESCRSSFHIECAQRWANESVSKFLISTTENGSTGNTNFHARNEKLLCNAKWCCPKCRFDYGFKQIPKEYKCFCGKIINPKPDSWTMPHSCGAVCKRALGCGHVCLMLCHPGPCPPCPKIVEKSCFCRKSSPKAVRCFQSNWACNGTCAKTLECTLHRCELKCHDGPCQICVEKFERPCACAKQCQMRPCAEKSWSCGQVCRKMLNCGKHTCPLECHTGQCQPCASANRLTCPCGKTAYSEGDCIDDLKCCGDTCGKLLDCLVHKCVERCHRGPCGSCYQERVKKCRCGVKEKVFICGKELLCDLKCKNKRQCGRHLCNRKCCPGGVDCPPPCEQICNKSLHCGNHRCTQVCHSGPCYPCMAMADVKCRCGVTVLKVSCGQERVTKPPKCKELCKVPPVCKHPNREAHRCHFGDCPPCRQVCNLLLKCGHTCSVRCHKGLLIDVNKSKNIKPATPWEKPQPKFELVDRQCPPCEHPVLVSCLGGHVTDTLPCRRAAPFDCGRPCGAALSCGNHKCQLACHPLNSSSSPCDDCVEKCSLPRHQDCPHQCFLPCHPGPCPPCRLMVRKLCLCGLNERLIPCPQWCQCHEEQRLELLACGNPCPKSIPCGHTCTFMCHAGPCSSPQNCTKRVQVKCPCRRKAVKTMCNKKSEVLHSLKCDEECDLVKQQQAAAKVQAKDLTTAVDDDKQGNAKDKEAESELNFSTSRRKRKKKLRNDGSECDDSLGIFKSGLFYFVVFGVGVLSASLAYYYFYLSNSQ